MSDKRFQAGTTRGRFLKTAGAFAFAPMPGGLFASEEKPLFRMGVMTDTHVGKTIDSCSRVKSALELFKARRVDVVVNNGDIADHFYPSGYRALREVYNSVYANPSERPREIWVYAWHDAYAFKKGAHRDETAKYSQEAFAEVRRLLEASDPVTASFSFRGVPMLVFNQYDVPETFERMVSEAVAANPGKPIFVFSHVPPSGTVYNSWNWGSRFQREIYDRFPQVVDFSGHVHGSLRNDLFIWQGNFTVVNSGCLQEWGGIPVNDDSNVGKQEYGVLTVDVFPSRLLIRRFDVRDGSEIEPDSPWNVALPFSAATAAYTPDRKKARAAVPQYPDGSRLEAKSGRDGMVTLSFPEVHGDVRSFIHRAEIERREADCSWRRFAVRETFGDYHLKNREQERRIVFQSGYFTPGEKIRFTVHPLNAYGVAGKPLVAEYAVPPQDDWRTVVGADGLSDGFRFVRNAKGDSVTADADGFYRPRTEAFLLMKSDAFAAKGGGRFRLVCDLDMRQDEEGSMWELSVVDAVSGRSLTRAVHTMPGAPGVLRHVFEFARPQGAVGDLALKFRRGATSRVRFVHVRLDMSGGTAA